MALASREDGGGQTFSARIRKTIQSIREIVGDHSDNEIYAALKESNMDPNETAQKLLNQDPFHEVKRKRDRKKENAVNATDTAKSQQNGQNLRRNPALSSKHLENIIQIKSQPSYRKDRASLKNTFPGVTREFRIVRDNRVNQNTDRDQESHCNSFSENEQITLNIQGTRMNLSRTMQQRLHTQNQISTTDPGNEHSKDACSVDVHRQGTGMPSSGSNFTLQHQHDLGQNLGSHSATLPSTTGLYSSSTSDPVHVPSLDTMSARAVGAIRREVGVVGVCQQSTDRSNLTFKKSVPNGYLPVLSAMKVTMTSSGSVDQAAGVSKSVPKVPGVPSGRTFSSSHYSGKPHQQPVGHKKATMEWKPKTSQKAKLPNPEVIDGASSPPTPCINSSILPNVEEICLQDAHLESNSNESEHVIIPQHCRVSDSERMQVKFGSFGDADPKDALQDIDNVDDSIMSLPVQASNGAVEIQVDAEHGSAETSQADALVPTDQPITGDANISGQIAICYADVGLVRSCSPSYTLESVQAQNSPGLLRFSEAFDSQQNYDTSFFTAACEDNIGQSGLVSHPEVSSSHRNSCPPSIAIVQQQGFHQQQQVGQLYPQAQLSHFANYMPYRQFISPLYVPPMTAVPNYSSNTAYTHLPNGSSYLVMPGGSPHLAAAPSAVKYTASQYKTVGGSNPSIYGNYTNTTGYNITAPGTGASIDDLTRIKYKDSNLYVANPQVEIPDIWVPNQRDSAPFYNIPAQGPPHAYLPTNTGHASFNPQAQPSTMQFPGIYQPQQPNAVANAHHLVHPQVPPGVTGNLGMVAPPPQFGAYQQPQLGPLNWTNNF